MSWLDDIQKDLEESKRHPIREKKDWEIERDIRVKDFTSDPSHQKKANNAGARKGGIARGRSKEGREFMRKIQKLSNPTGPKNFKQRNEFRIYKDGKVIGKYGKIVDIAKAYGCSPAQMSLYINGKKPSPEGYKFEKIRIRKPDLRTRRKYGEDDAWKAQ